MDHSVLFANGHCNTIQNLKNFSIVSTHDYGDYFTAMLLRTGCIYMDEEPAIIPFQVIFILSSLIFHCD
jgi:hypothetical protein